MQGFICHPRIYEHEGWAFEFPRYGPPWPLRKDGGLRKRAGRRFYKMIDRFLDMPEDEQEKCRAGGGCVQLEAKEARR